MDARQYGHIARSSALVALFSTRPETNRITGLPAAFALHAAQLDLVETLVKRQAQPLALVLHDRDVAFTAMKIAALLVGGKVSAFAARTHSDTLALKVKVKSNDLDRVRFVERVRSCQRIHDAVAEVLAAVAPSGVTPAMLDDLQTSIGAARSFLTAPRTTVVDKSTATVQLAEAIRELTAILTQQIEPLVAPCEFTHREFFLKYRAARKLIAPPGATSDDVEAAASDTPSAPLAPATPEPADPADDTVPPAT